ncbi:MAG TPA: twin-arginine translocase TatA/TatE family subunit [Oligoflexia bacterium]|nr:twin-arginine translocase TatA/TatE family subunit [Oligoflexia bacterium]HMP49622.1 twin-arginine translocase TatA/TatE family subunit [Oligoflexia bacterium]
MFGLGPWELGVILVIVIIMFGVGKLPEIGSGLGEGIKNFRKSIKDVKSLDDESSGSSDESKKS